MVRPSVVKTSSVRSERHVETTLLLQRRYPRLNVMTGVNFSFITVHFDP